jgi:hypothetical protein
VGRDGSALGLLRVLPVQPVPSPKLVQDPAQLVAPGRFLGRALGVAPLALQEDSPPGAAAAALHVLLARFHQVVQGPAQLVARGRFLALAQGAASLVLLGHFPREASAAVLCVPQAGFLVRGLGPAQLAAQGRSLQWMVRQAARLVVRERSLLLAQHHAPHALQARLEVVHVRHVHLVQPRQEGLPLVQPARRALFLALVLQAARRAAPGPSPVQLQHRVHRAVQACTRAQDGTLALPAQQGLRPLLVLELAPFVVRGPTPRPRVLARALLVLQAPQVLP